MRLITIGPANVEFATALIQTMGVEEYKVYGG